MLACVDGVMGLVLLKADLILLMQSPMLLDVKNRFPPPIAWLAMVWQTPSW